MTDQTEDTFQSFHHAEKTTDEPLIRVMALHALAYCERLYYLEEVEEIRVADANVYSGRRLHDKIDKGPDIYSLELASERLGIRGKIDCVKRRSGELVVSEHKKGKSNKGEEAWPSDRLQVLAYALLLGEHTGEQINEAHIRYHADNRTIKIRVSPEEAEKEVEAAVQRAWQLRSALQRPPVTASEYQCRTCSLAPVCLPEEERFSEEQGDRKVQRLFPQDDERRVIHLVEQGASIRKDGEQFVIYLTDGTKKQLPGRQIGSLVLHGNVQISTQCIHFCAANNIGVHWLSFGGHYVGGLQPGSGGVQRRVRQYQALSDPGLCRQLTRRLALAKIENQLRYILRATRDKKQDSRDKETELAIEQLRASIKALSSLDGDAAQKVENEDTGKEPIDFIRGHEGIAGRIYFSLLPRILKLAEDDFLAFDGRNRRPPRDPFNAMLSFGYALLYKDCVAALQAVGLDPSFGFMHTPRSAAYPLALDLMDLFRLILWDIPLIGSVNRKQWSKDDFAVTGKQVWLNADGRRKAISIYESRKQEKWKHPVLNYSLSYARTIELEARLLEKEWGGQPGLFAGLRLR
ncbi:MAG: type I-MYXAN CRISPR-associated endonuclease Cas1 [Proteobacteria bacterium]|nr:type I-MYXAN CRISPR-associated endonuclease Cas1 [Pseudomonadota bacterium]MBU0966428.1 type I-MYXAN CRISPR-associated endonuclease Cas1 [Pseudomonadota bacterium]